MNKLELQKKANEVRKGIVTAVHAAKAGHPGGSLSAADIFTYLYFEELNIDPEFYTLRQRPLDELLPWDFINAGVTKKFLQKEWKTAMEETVTPNCRMKCSGCGAGKYKGGVCVEG